MVSACNYFIGIDGGGTKCRARLCAASGEVLGEGIGGQANVRLGLDFVIGNINTAIDMALSNAGIKKEIANECAIGIGLAGLSNKNDENYIKQAFSEFKFVNLASDAHIACLGAYNGGDGAILISGTGSVGYAIIEGTSHKIGGWGFEVSDDGSGAALGRQALHATLLCYDGIRPHSAFSYTILEKFDNNPRNIVKWVTGAKPKDFGEIAPIVIEFAQNGDLIATELVQNAANKLGSYIARLNNLGAQKICMLGGMADLLKPWLAPWTQKLLAEPMNDAVSGAILLAKSANNGLVD